MTNVNVNCNGFDNIEFWDSAGRQYNYCEDINRPSSVTFYTDHARWIGISRLGRVAFNLDIKFTDHYNTGITTEPVYTTTTTTTTTTTKAPPRSSTYIICMLITVNLIYQFGNIYGIRLWSTANKTRREWSE